MPDLKLAKLPDRTPVKHTIVVMPELEQKLRDYVNLYQQVYDAVELIETLIPYMLETFLDGDRDFMKARRNNAASKDEIRSPQRSTRRSLGTKFPTPNGQ